MSRGRPLHGFGGSGSDSLNFKIIAYDTEEELLAATPKENTIGVIPGTKLTSWIFDSSEPSDPTEGMLWIRTGTASGVLFNALKKNGITVYPISAEQYIDGAWVDVTCKSYQGGEWVSWWAGELVTGAILPSNFALHSYMRSDASDVYTVEMSEELGGLYVKAAAQTQSYTTGYILPKIDLTDWSKLTVKWKAHGYACTVGFVESIVADNTKNQSYIASASITKTGNAFSDETTSEIDVSAMDGEYIFALTVAGSGSSSYTGEILVMSAILT